MVDPRQLRSLTTESRAQPSVAASPSNHRERKAPDPLSTRFQNGTVRSRKQHNLNVSNILPLTTFRTIDLGGRKNPSSLFSRFCAELRVFFEEFSAREIVQQQAYLSGPTAGGLALADDFSISARPFLASWMSSGCVARWR